MKNITTFFLSLLLLSSCATARVDVPDPYANISVDNVKENCEAVENWQVGVMGVPGLVIRFDNCLGVKSLLVIATDYDGTGPGRHGSTILDSSMGLMALHYTEYLDRTNEVETTEVVRGKEAHRVHLLKKIKEEIKEGWVTHYYEITYTMETCGLDTCVNQG
jgi:hypothetical protein